MNIIELAKQSGLVRVGDFGMKRWEGPRSDSISDQDLKAFAELIAAQEREACAQLVDHILKQGGGTWGDAIRARQRGYGDGKAAQQEAPVAHCEAGPEYCVQCKLEDRSIALAAAVRYVKNNTPQLVSDEICMALATPPQPEERNFCPRCGKRTKDIHTCTPPQENT